jgi:lysophospholipase L1-like esterase
MTSDVSTPTRAPLSRRRLILFASLPAVVLLLACIAAGEAVLRWRERTRDSVPGTMPLLYYRHARLGHALVRGSDYFGWVHQNPQGFRGVRPTTRERAPGTLRVMVVGSSTTHDSYVGRDDDAWPHQLEARLRTRTGRDVEVINAGVPGYTMIDDIVRFEHELRHYQPDLVVLYEGHNDLFGALKGLAGPPYDAHDSRPDEVDVETPWGRWLTSHSLLYGKVVGRAQAIGFRARGAEERESDAALEERLARAVRDGAARHERQMTAFVVLAQAQGIRVVIPQLVHLTGAGRTSEPDSSALLNWQRTVPFATPPAVLRGYVAFDSAARRVAERLDLVHVPTEAFGLHGAEWYAADDPIHFNARGAARMADHLAVALDEAGVLREQAPRAAPPREVPPRSAPRRTPEAAGTAPRVIAATP